QHSSAPSAESQVPGGVNPCSAPGTWHSALFPPRRMRGVPRIGSRFFAGPILIVVRRCRIELPSMLIATSFFLSDLQLFIVLISDADRLTEIVDHVLLRRGGASRHRLVSGGVRFVPSGVDVAT